MSKRISTKPYLCIPFLVEQPTWGGQYIIEFKSWTEKEELAHSKIGQSYELYGKTNLSLSLKDSSDRNFYFDSHTVTDNQDKFSLTELIERDPIGVLGSKVFLKHGKMPILLKFNQSLGNSFQLHTKNPNERWDSKPEAWYYLESGLVTFGVREDVNWEKYQAVCTNIEHHMNLLSKKVRNEFLRLDEARIQAQKIIKEEHPVDFVNIHKVQKGEIIDLSGGGVHHSWEEDTEELPLGNIVYEIQLDRKDEDVTIRSFDQGKIKDDGSVRQIHVEDYFFHADRTPEHNLLEVAQDKPYTLSESIESSVRRILFNEHYGMEEIEVVSKISNKYTETTDTFHHLFVRDGKIELKCEQETLTITKGHSAFVPASTGKYELYNKNATPSVIIKSYC